jgi:hypothetical protein
LVRCTRINNLNVYYKFNISDNSQNNAIVLCDQCYEKSSYFKNIKIEFMSFSLLTKIKAKVNADFMCECTNDRGCH